MNSNATFIHGANEWATDRFNNRTVGDVRNMSLVQDTLNLQGNESAVLEDSYGEEESVADNYVIQAGDTIRFTRQAGTKG